MSDISPWRQPIALTYAEWLELLDEATEAAEQQVMDAFKQDFADMRSEDDAHRCPLCYMRFRVDLNARQALMKRLAGVLHGRNPKVPLV